MYSQGCGGSSPFFGTNYVYYCKIKDFSRSEKELLKFELLNFC